LLNGQLYLQVNSKYDHEKIRVRVSFVNRLSSSRCRKVFIILINQIPLVTKEWTQPVGMRTLAVKVGFLF